MKIKVGQWVRTKYNEIVKVLELIDWCKKENEYVYYTAIIDKKMLYTSFNEKRLHTDITKVANTPQELGSYCDLVNVEGESLFLTIKDYYYDEFQEQIGYVLDDDCNYSFNEITKILTPNSNGGYDLQWEESK